jgi:hypothetical protein
MGEPMGDRYAGTSTLAGAHRHDTWHLGFGHIGDAVAQRARAFGMAVCAVRRHAQPDAPEGVAFIAGPERLDEVLAFRTTLPSLCRSHLKRAVFSMHTNLGA